MHPAGLTAADGAELQLDVCRNCQIVWLDAGEMERLPASASLERHPTFSPDAAEALAPLLIEREKQRGEAAWGDSGLPGNNAPDSPLAALLTYLGFPMEENAPVVRTRPYLTWTVGLLCALATLGAIFSGTLDQAVARYGFLPADPLRAGGVTPLTSFFLHGGLLHLVFNMWFLVLAGDNCEDLLGGPRYLALLAVGSLAALVTHGALDPRADVPLVGASGGISGLLAFYALALPRVRLVMCLRLGWYPIWLRMSAATALVIWVGFQVLGSFLQMDGYGTTSNLAHLGGAFAGVGAWLLFRRPAERLR